VSLLRVPYRLAVPFDHRVLLHRHLLHQQLATDVVIAAIFGLVGYGWQSTSSNRHRLCLPSSWVR
jgi:hypothetical protein